MKFIIISLCALLLATTPLSGRDGKQIMGFYSLQTGRSYINIKNNKSTKDLVATSATESQRAMDHQRGIDFLRNEDDHSTYSQNFGNAVARYYGYAISSYGSGYGSAKINNPSSINQNYYASNNKEFSRLDKQKGANRQLLDEEVHKIYELSKIYSEKKNIPLEKGTAIVSKAFYGLVDKDANDMYETNLDTEEAFEYLEAQDFLKSKIGYSRIIPTYDNEFSGMGWAFKEQYDDRYSNLKGYSRNKKFYEKYLKIDNPADTFSFSGLADSIKNFADGFTKPFKDLANEATNNTSEFLKATAIGILNPFKSGSNFGENSHKTYEEANLDDFLGDKQGRDQKRGEIAGNIAPIIAGGTIGSILKKGKNIHKAGDVGTAEGAGTIKLSTAVGETAGAGTAKAPTAISEAILSNNIKITQDEMIHVLDAANQLDRNKLTKAGRAIQKHGDRPGDIIEKVKGNAAVKNSEGIKLVKKILTDSNLEVKSYYSSKYKANIKDYRSKNGGIRMNIDSGEFMGFLKPQSNNF